MQLSRHRKCFTWAEIVPPRQPCTQSDQSIIEKICFLRKKGVDGFSVPRNPLGRLHQSNIEFFCRFLRPQDLTILHIPVANHTANTLKQELVDILRIGIRHILLLSGDFASQQTEGLDTIDAIYHAKQFEALKVGCVVNLTPVYKKGMQPEPHCQQRRLQAKLRAGADFIISQPVFDAAAASRFLHSYTIQYGPILCPLYIGLMAITSSNQLEDIDRIPGVFIPARLKRKLLSSQNPATFRSVGLDISREVYTQLHSLSSVSGVHLTSPSQNFDLII